MSDRRRDFEPGHPCNVPGAGGNAVDVEGTIDAGVGNDYVEPEVNEFPFEEEEQRWLAPSNQIDFQMSIDQVSRYKTIINQSCFFMRYYRANSLEDQFEDPHASRFIYTSLIPPSTNPSFYNALQLNDQHIISGAPHSNMETYEAQYSRAEFTRPEGFEVFGQGPSLGERSLLNGARMPGQFRWPIMSIQTNSQRNNDASCDRSSVQPGDTVSGCRTRSIDAFRFCAGKFWFFNGHSAEFYSPEQSWDVPGSMFNYYFVNPTVGATHRDSSNGENRWYYKSPNGQVAMHERIVVDFYSMAGWMNLGSHPGYGYVFNRPRPAFTNIEDLGEYRDVTGLYPLNEDDRNDQIMRERWRLQNDLPEGYGIHPVQHGIKDQFHPASFNPPFNLQQFRYQGAPPPMSLDVSTEQTLIPSNNELYGLKNVDLARWILGPFWAPPNRPTGLVFPNAAVPDDMYEIYTRIVCPNPGGPPYIGCSADAMGRAGDYRARFHQKGLFGFDRSFVDTVHDTPMPFFTKESEAVNFNSQQNASIELKNNFLDGEYKQIQDELELSNIYRQYSKYIIQEGECVDDRHVKFTSRNVQDFKKVKDTLQYHFPMTVNIKFQTYQGSRAAGYFRKTGMDKYFLDFLSHLQPGSDLLYAEVLDQRHLLQADRTGVNNNGSAEEYRTVLGQGENDDFTIDNERTTVDLLKWIDSYLSSDVISNIKDREFPLRVFPKSEDDPSGQLSRDSEWTVFLANINKMVLKQELLEYSWDYSGDSDFAPPNDVSEFPDRNKYFRCMEDIFKGKKAYSEVVAYKIEKIDTSIPNHENQVVQTFYFFDSDEIQEIDFVDSQVVYGKTYIYRLYAYTMVIGTEYQYVPAPMKDQIQSPWANMASSDIESRKQIVDFVYDNMTPNEEQWNPHFATYPKIVMDIFSRPHLSIVEVPFHETTIKIQDRPPTSPDVLFLPYKDIINKTKVVITAEPGEHALVPIGIDLEDQDIIQQMHASQDHEDEKILYKTDDLPKYFEVFRTTKPPADYASFRGKKLQTIETNGGQSVSIEHFIQPNTKYYYTVRAVDELFFSNPTDVYCVELVHIDDGMFLNVEIYEFPVKKDIFKMPFKDRVLIRPARMQRAMDVASLFGADLFPNLETDEVTGLPADTNLQQIKDAVKTINSTLAWAPGLGYKPSLGLYDGEAEIYNQKYKFRITSKNTGKQIDVNARFVFDVEKFNFSGHGVPTVPELCPPRAMINPQSDPLVEGGERGYVREQEREYGCPPGYEQVYWGEGERDFDCVLAEEVQECVGDDCDMDETSPPIDEPCPPGTTAQFDEDGTRTCVPLQDDQSPSPPEEVPPDSELSKTQEMQDSVKQLLDAEAQARVEMKEEYKEEYTTTESEAPKQVWQVDRNSFNDVVTNASANFVISNAATKTEVAEVDLNEDAVAVTTGGSTPYTG